MDRLIEIFLFEVSQWSMDGTRPQFQHLSIQYTANRGPAQRNNFHNPIIVYMLNLIL